MLAPALLGLAVFALLGLYFVPDEFFGGGDGGRARLPCVGRNCRNTVSAPRSPSRPVPAVARVRGDYDLGEGYVLRVKIDRDSNMMLQLCRDSGWGEEPIGRPIERKEHELGSGAAPSDDAATEAQIEFGRHRFRGQFWAVGDSRVIRPASGTVGIGPATWLDHGKLFHVYVGTPDSEAFRRSNLAHCTVFLTMGGDDRVVYEESCDDAQVMRDIMVGAQGERLEIPAQTRVSAAQKQATDPQCLGTNETPAKVVGADSLLE